MIGSGIIMTLMRIKAKQESIDKLVEDIKDSYEEYKEAEMLEDDESIMRAKAKLIMNNLLLTYKLIDDKNDVTDIIKESEKISNLIKLGENLDKTN